VDQHHVKVRIGAQGASPIPTDGQKGEVAAGVASGPFGQAREPFVRFDGVSPAEFLSPEGGISQQGLPPYA
jgi:hypothetical protein